MSLKMMEQKLLDWIDFLAPISYPVKISLQTKKDRESFPDLFRFLFHSYSTLKRYGYTGC